MQHWEAEFVWIADTVLQQSSDVWSPTGGFRNQIWCQWSGTHGVVVESTVYSVSVFCNSKYSNRHTSMHLIQVSLDITVNMRQGGGGQEQDAKNIGMGLRVC